MKTIILNPVGYNYDNESCFNGNVYAGNVSYRICSTLKDELKSRGINAVLTRDINKTSFKQRLETAQTAIMENTDSLFLSIGFSMASFSDKIKANNACSIGKYSLTSWDSESWKIGNKLAELGSRFFSNFPHTCYKLDLKSFNADSIEKKFSIGLKQYKKYGLRDCVFIELPTIHNDTAANNYANYERINIYINEVLLYLCELYGFISSPVAVFDSGETSIKCYHFCDRFEQPHSTLIKNEKYFIYKIKKIGNEYWYLVNNAPSKPSRIYPYSSVCGFPGFDGLKWINTKDQVIPDIKTWSSGWTLSELNNIF